MILTKQPKNINKVFSFFIFLYIISFFFSAIQSNESFSINIKGYESALAVIQSVYSCCSFETNTIAEIFFGVLFSIFLASTNFIVLSSILFYKMMKLNVIMILTGLVFFSSSYWIISSIIEGEFVATISELKLGYWLWLISCISIMGIICLKIKDRSIANIANQ